MMEKRRSANFAFVLLLCTTVIISAGVAAKAGDDHDNLSVEEEAGAARIEGEGRGRSWVEEALVDAISVFTVTSAAPPCATPHYWDRLRTWVLDPLLAYLFPPKIE